MVTTGSNATGNATAAAATPAMSGADGLRTASTYRSRRRTKSRATTKPPTSAAAVTMSPIIMLSC